MNFEITLNRILGLIVIFLAVMIVSTTAVVSTQKKNRSRTIVTALPGNESDGTIYVSYRELGMLRSTTAPDKKNKKGTAVVLSPVLTYQSDDEEFFEELSRKNQEIKAVFTEYFSAHTKTELNRLGESAVKEELRAKINSMLSLNKIHEVYFESLTYLEIPNELLVPEK